MAVLLTAPEPSVTLLFLLTSMFKLVLSPAQRVDGVALATAVIPEFGSITVTLTDAAPVQPVPDSDPLRL